MKSDRPIKEAPSGRILLMVLAMFFPFCVGPADAASEPGAITIALLVEPMTLDPGDTSRSVEGQVLKENVLETLTESNPDDSSIMPRLATAWKQIDPKTWQFFLRKGVRFHDGAEFNAEAAVFNIKRLFDKRIDSHMRTRFFANVKLEGRALESHTLELKTDKFEPLLPNLMAIVSLCSPNTPVDKITRNPIGTGPYKFVKWDAGTQIVLERFDGYWGKQPQVKKVTYLWRTESSVRAAMIAIGEADLASNISREDANRPDMDFSYLNSETTSLRFGGAWEPPLNDRRVRMAFNLALNREAIRGSILPKDVIPATQPIVPSIFGHNPDLKVWPYDPQKAKQLLDEARKDGVPVDKEILLVGRIGHFPGDQEFLEAMVTMYKAVGLNIKLRMFDQVVVRTYHDKPYPTNVGPYIVQKQDDNSKGDAVFTLFTKYHCKGSQSPICDKQVDDLIDKAQVATGEERRKLWQAASKRVYEEIIPDVMQYHMVAYCRVGKRINFKPSLATINEIQLAQITFKQ